MGRSRREDSDIENSQKSTRKRVNKSRGRSHARKSLSNNKYRNRERGYSKHHRRYSSYSDTSETSSDNNRHRKIKSKKSKRSKQDVHFSQSRTREQTHTPPVQIPQSIGQEFLPSHNPQMSSNFWAQNNFPVSFSVVPEFDPSDNSQTIENWINKVNECAQIYSWNDRQICHYALPKLIGLAKKWYQGLPSVLFSWEQWTEKLKQAFPSNENYGDLLSSMLRLRCKFGQSLEHYYYDKMTLINKCEITGSKAVGCLINGIDDKFVRMGAGACMFHEPEQVLNYLRTVSQHEHSIQNVRGEHFNQLKPFTKNNSELMKGVSEGHQPPLRCFNCGEMGHISLKCNKPLKRCNLCFKLGHETKDCRHRIPNEGANKTFDVNQN